MNALPVAFADRHLSIEYVDPCSLHMAARNARTHSPRQVSQLAKAIREFGFSNPILIDEGREIIAGHGRLAAALELHMIAVPVIVLDGLTSTQKRALALADNRIAQNAGWNTDLLASELKELEATSLDLELLGFRAPELANLLGRPDASPASAEYKPTFAVVIDLESEAAQLALLERLAAEGYKCKALIA